MIKRETITEAMYNAIRLGATKMPPDVRKALQCALAEEVEPMAKKHLEVSLSNADAAERGAGLVCADTGFPMFFVHIGKNCQLEGGFASVQFCAEQATARATAECFLRPTMVHPLTRKNPGNNIGPGATRKIGWWQASGLTFASNFKVYLNSVTYRDGTREYFGGDLIGWFG